jgi:hypothetical protein
MRNVAAVAPNSAHTQAGHQQKVFAKILHPSRLYQNLKEKRAIALVKLNSSVSLTPPNRTRRSNQQRERERGPGTSQCTLRHERRSQRSARNAHTAVNTYRQSQVYDAI